MQTCKFSLTLHAANIFPMRGVTPAELVLLHRLHFRESNGSPIGADLQLEPGEALTIEKPYKAGEEAYFHTGSGKHIEAKPEVPAVTHVRTNQEELARLKRRYVAKIPDKPDSKGAFVDVFGDSPMVDLPTKFEQVLGKIGLQDPDTGELLILPADAAPGELDDHGQELAKKTRADLASIALGLKLAIRATDSKDVLITKILKAQAPKSEA